MDFVFSESFLRSYERLSDDKVVIIDDAILRLLADHDSAWARQGRVVGEVGSAWIITVAARNFDVSLYWDYYEEQSIVLLALILA
jgi:hypothetical protein